MRTLMCWAGLADCGQRVLRKGRVHAWLKTNPLKTNKLVNWQYAQCACRQRVNPSAHLFGPSCVFTYRRHPCTHSHTEYWTHTSIHIYQWITWIFNQEMPDRSVDMCWQREGPSGVRQGHHVLRNLQRCFWRYAPYALSEHSDSVLQSVQYGAMSCGPSNTALD